MKKKTPKFEHLGFDTRCLGCKSIRKDEEYWCEKIGKDQPMPIKCCDDYRKK